MNPYARARVIPIIITVGDCQTRADVPYGVSLDISRAMLAQMKWHALEHLKAERHAKVDVMMDGESLGPEASMHWVQHGWLH